MKTKIVYISGNEIFDMSDIRAAFEEVRNALNLDKNTVLFGVPIDEDDIGLSKQQPTESIDESKESVISASIVDIPEKDEIKSVDIPEQIIDEVVKDIEQDSTSDIEPEEEEPEKIVEINIDSGAKENNEKVVPILSVLSTGKSGVESDEQTESDNDIQIIEDIHQETASTIENIEDEYVNEKDSMESDLEQLLSEMKPLQEDILDDSVSTDDNVIEDDENVDATLEKLATEFVQNQDKIAANTKSSNRSRIGKLRNILPFKQSKHHDQGLGDLFGWAGVAANDEEFSVPGFFTTASSKK
ncbi:MAG: hypothetical protein J6S57_00650 [Alphaproteobacteria bacterium]|nr:hypothetical protein [Alphaproteobacteria bacterium]